ncbi:ROK family protein [Clostridium butyricum]|uniref:ROK family protein n=1 Tax=Clostridium butyricum TaxID=1492 RepID=UPI0005C195C7|nr:ROK family protein [Clostridium butyricum]KIU06611.1 N-acetylmannosamine kinase [Clostridium butyricum]MBA8966448.1 putative NBD/HSP70 family sugar kinase [Clostridium butyricum]MBA8972488.1 putative NBD/HSP70 family sugar kinase [Clostridium butyricum]MBC2429402.1 ROK family protein [Clostridium butyricum]NOW35649.1 putative NBD/HSP70 family sugar kinase [Clostridium butyricum]
MKFYVSIDIGGTSIKHGILDKNIKFITSGEIATEAQKGGKNILEKVINIVSEYKKEYTLSGICISTAGMVDCEKGEIIHASDLIPNYTGTQIKKTLEDIFSIPCEVENDVNCAGLAEYFSGSAKGSSISLCLTIGTGIGGSIIINDKVFHGFSGSACEVGYMNMFKSKFEDLGATSILVKKVAKLKNCSENHIDGKLIFEMAKNNDEDCIKAIDEMVDVLGMGIANICYVINPEVVVLGGGIMAQKDYLYDKIRLSLDKYLIPTISSKTKLEFAKNQNKAGMLGAYYNFISIHKD